MYWTNKLHFKGFFYRLLHCKYRLCWKVTWQKEVVFVLVMFQTCEVVKPIMFQTYELVKPKNAYWHVSSGLKKGVWNKISSF